jgi:hypothetical protein
MEMIADILRLEGRNRATHDCSRYETRCVYGYWQESKAMAPHEDRAETF